MTFPFVPLPITVLNFLHDMEHLREWNNVKYVPMKVLRDPNRKWLSAGWLSKQVKKLDLQQFKPSQNGLTTGSGEGGRTGEYLKLEDAPLCLPHQKLADFRKTFQLDKPQQVVAYSLPYACSFVCVLLCLYVFPCPFAGRTTRSSHTINR